MRYILGLVTCLVSLFFLAFSYGQSIDSYKAQIDSYKDKITALERQRDGYYDNDKRYDGVKQECRDLEKQINRTIRNEQDPTSLNLELSTCRDKIANINGAIESYTEKISELESIVDDLKTQDKINKKVQNKNKQITKKQKEISELSDKIAAACPINGVKSPAQQRKCDRREKEKLLLEQDVKGLKGEISALSANGSKDSNQVSEGGTDAESTRRRGPFGSEPLEILDRVVHDANSQQSIQDTALNNVTHTEGAYPTTYRLANTLDSIRRRSGQYLDRLFYVGLSVAVILIIWNGLQLVVGKDINDIRKPLTNVVVGVFVLTGVYLIIKLVASVVALIFNV